MSNNKHLGEVVQAYIDAILWIEGIDHADTTESFDSRALEDCREFLNEIKHLEHDLNPLQIGHTFACSRQGSCGFDFPRGKDAVKMDEIANDFGNLELIVEVGV